MQQEELVEQEECQEELILQCSLTWRELVVKEEQEQELLHQVDQVEEVVQELTKLIKC
jgi:hypothetical protein